MFGTFWCFGCLNLVNGKQFSYFSKDSCSFYSIHNFYLFMNDFLLDPFLRDELSVIKDLRQGS